TAATRAVADKADAELPERQGGLHFRLAGIGKGVAIGPCRLLQIERAAAMADAAAVGIGKTPTIEELCGQSRRVEAAECGLRVGSIGEPEGADAAVAPRLAHQPSERVAAVLGLAQVFCELAARTIAAAAVLIGDGIAACAADRGHGAALRPNAFAPEASLADITPEGG